MHLGLRSFGWVSLRGMAITLIAVFVLAGCASSQSTVTDESADEQPAATETETTADEADSTVEDDDSEPSGDTDDDEDEAATDDAEAGDDEPDAADEDPWSDDEPDAEAAPEPLTTGADRSTQYAHIDDFDLEFKNARINMANAELLFDELGEGDDIPDSFDNLLESADHEFRFDDVAPLVEAELPEDLGDAMGIFVLLSSKYGLIGCEAHLRGQDGQDWNDNLFGYLLEQAADLPADQRNNQAGLLVIGSNVVSSQLCPRLQSHT